MEEGFSLASGRMDAADYHLPSDGVAKVVSFSVVSVCGCVCLSVCLSMR